ncbi:hypothetical protein LZ31DRAFT_547980 [Colletotrichum somersetense]|nr:hypothetical protein LZ31DRAFT_547980 [Colletotrichum somersetense]
MSATTCLCIWHTTQPRLCSFEASIGDGEVLKLANRDKKSQSSASTARVLSRTWSTRDSLTLFERASLPGSTA